MNGSTADLSRTQSAERSPSAASFTGAGDVAAGGGGGSALGLDASSVAYSSDGLDEEGMPSSATYRSSSRASMRSDVSGRLGGEANAALRAELHELKRILRQKNAVIARYESSASQPAAPPRASSSFFRSIRGGTPTPTSGGTPSKLKKNKPTSSAPSSPAMMPFGLPGVAGDPDAGPSRSGAVSPSGESVSSTASDTGSRKSRTRSRKGSTSSHRNSAAGLLASPAVSRSPRLGGYDDGEGRGSRLGTVKEANRSQLPLGEGFLAPTIASENKRVLSSQAAMAAAAHSPSGGSDRGGTSKVIAALNADLSSTRSALDSTKNELRLSQRSVATLTRQIEDVRDSKERVRLENETLSHMLARKERALLELSERFKANEKEMKKIRSERLAWEEQGKEVSKGMKGDREAREKAENEYAALKGAIEGVKAASAREVAAARRRMDEQARRHARETEALLKKREAVERMVAERNKEREDLALLLADERRSRDAFASRLEALVLGLRREMDLLDAKAEGYGGMLVDARAEVQRILRLAQTASEKS